ncbi:MAG TPA: hypothetical protein VNJ53_02770 [Gaiellaceae bacterium]|nr:hypothetical protein [Gaiellaceae bacterium]
MHELTTSAILVDEGALDLERAPTAVLPRAELEAARAASAPARLWFDVGTEEETRRVEVDLELAQIEALLGQPGGYDIVLALDADGLTGLFEDGEVEAHGLRAALAIAATSAAVLAPVSQAALPQSVNPSVSPQVSAASVESANVERAVVGSAVRSQARTLARTQARTQAKAQLAKAFVVQAAGVDRVQGWSQS